MKITTLENIQSFGGLNFVSAEFDHLKLPEMIAQHLGERAPQARFSYSDMIRNMWWGLCRRFANQFKKRIPGDPAPPNMFSRYRAPATEILSPEQRNPSG